MTRFYYSDDPVADADSYFADQDEALKKLPVCCECGEHIQQEDAVRIGDDWYCDECLSNKRVFLEV